MPSTDAERAFVEALLREVVALEQYAEEAVELAQEALGAAGDLAQLRIALEGQIAILRDAATRSMTVGAA